MTLILVCCYFLNVCICNPRNVLLRVVRYWVGYLVSFCFLVQFILGYNTRNQFYIPRAARAQRFTWIYLF